MRYVLRLFTDVCGLLDLLTFDCVDDITGGHNTNKEEDILNEFLSSLVHPANAFVERKRNLINLPHIGGLTSPFVHGCVRLIFLLTFAESHSISANAKERDLYTSRS